MIQTLPALRRWNQLAEPLPDDLTCPFHQFPHDVGSRVDRAHNAKPWPACRFIDSISPVAAGSQEAEHRLATDTRLAHYRLTLSYRV